MAVVRERSTGDTGMIASFFRADRCLARMIVLLPLLAGTLVRGFHIAPRGAAFTTRQWTSLWKSCHCQNDAATTSAKCHSDGAALHRIVRWRQSLHRVQSRSFLAAIKGTVSIDAQGTVAANPLPSKVVVFQKVVSQSSSTGSAAEFLGRLVDYLQDEWELPERLPMVYERRVPVYENDDQGDIETIAASVVVQWNSPLSPNPAATALSVQVVAIYPNTTMGSGSSATNDPPTASTANHLAMVVVEKSQLSGSAAAAPLPPLLKNLFADSEKKILKALDRGLDDFCVSASRSSSHKRSRSRNESASTTSSSSSSSSSPSAANAVSDSVPSSATPSPPNLNPDSPKILDVEYDRVVVPTTISASAATPKDASQLDDDDTNRRRMQQEAAWQSMMRPGWPTESNSTSTSTRASVNRPTTNSSISSNATTTTTSSTSLNGLEFAVQAAKLAQAKRQAATSTSAASSPKENDFAVSAAAKMAELRPKSRSSMADEDRRSNRDDVKIAELDITKIRPPLLDPQVSGKQRAFMTTISKPSDYVESSNVRPDDVVRSDNVTVAKSSNPTTVSPVSNNSRTVNLNMRTTVEREPKFGLDSVAVGDNRDDDGIAAAAQSALDEMIEQGQDMSPEEMLAQVMQFGDDQERKNDVGDGFASAALEKAKDVLRQQYETRHSRQRDGNPEPSTVASTDSSTFAEVGVAVKKLTPEEELRRMFEAGERIAEGRMTTMSTPATAGTLRDQAEIDALIASDSSVSSYGRILDDELAELEVRINKSPGQEWDGPNKYPLFDIFSGPEVYDPNVDPLTAVNWPGALPGTKDVKLPRELQEAVKQASFAVEVLRNLRQVSSDSETKFVVGQRELSAAQVEDLRAVVEQAVEIGLVPDPVQYEVERSRLQMVLDELAPQPDERVREIISEYKDLLLSDNFVTLVKERLQAMANRDLEALRNDDDSLEAAHARERFMLGQLVAYAQILLKEVQALGAELESQQLEVIRSICKVAMDPAHLTEEETAMALKDAVQDMRPLFDDAFVAYLKYAVAEEEGRLARAGVLDDPEHNRWLCVLKIVQQGVYAEISKGINRYLEHIWYILRMETPRERRLLLGKLVDDMPTLDVRPFVQVVENIADALGDGVRGEFDGVIALGEMTNKLLQLHRDLREVLPPERIAQKSRDADEWAAKQKERLMERRNFTKQRLKAAQETEYLDSEIEAMGRWGEVERFD
jgi:hypothetical protein